MKFTFGSLLGAVLLMVPGADASSFLRDVVGEKSEREDIMENALFEKAIPLTEFRAKLRAHGMDFEEDTHRDLNNGGNNYNYNYNAGDDAYYKNNAGQYGDDDDYYVSYKKNFNSYSLKYAKCQPVQRFSEEAIEAGEASPMLTDDIVILRLCPSKSCSSSKTYGCMSNYAEYAIGMTDYVRIMLYYREDRMDQLCDWCSSCYSRRELDDNNNNNRNYYTGDDKYYNGDDDNNSNNNNDDAGDDDAWAGYTRYGYGSSCDDYKTYCYDSDSGYSLCESFNDNDGSQYLDYLNCVNVQDQDNYNYYVRPRCDGTNQIIHMGLYHDNYCSQYAGDEVDIDSFNLGFDDADFEEFYTDVDCLDCTKSVSILFVIICCIARNQKISPLRSLSLFLCLVSLQNSPPNFLASHSLCNRMHKAGAACTERLSDYYLQLDEDNSVCTYIQSMKNGNYDTYGSLAQAEAGVMTHVTDQEKAWLVISVITVVLLVAFATFLHGQVTDVQIESMAHSELLPSKAGSRKLNRLRKPRSASRTRKTVYVAAR
jgi:hypothetical protein